MMSVATPVLALFLGLASTLHCWGMCGGIITALNLAIPADTGGAGPDKRLLVIGYNLGRIASYTGAGAVAGMFGLGLQASPLRETGFFILQLAAAAALVTLGLRLGGWLRGGAFLENAGWRLWQYIRPLTRVFLPVSDLWRALAVGAVWGWLPCGLVYATLIWAAAAADPVHSAGIMLAFGIGTLPGMSVAGLAGGALLGSARAQGLKRLVGGLIVVVGLAVPLVSLLTGPHAGHGAQPMHLHH